MAEDREIEKKFQLFCLLLVKDGVPNSHEAVLEYGAGVASCE